MNCSYFKVLNNWILIFYFWNLIIFYIVYMLVFVCDIGGISLLVGCVLGKNLIVIY